MFKDDHALPSINNSHLFFSFLKNLFTYCPEQISRTAGCCLTLQLICEPDCMIFQSYQQYVAVPFNSHFKYLMFADLANFSHYSRYEIISHIVFIFHWAAQ